MARVDLRSPEMRARDAARIAAERANGTPRFRYFQGPAYLPHTSLDPARPIRVVAGNTYWNNSLAAYAFSRRYHFATMAEGERARRFLEGLKRGDEWTDEDVYAAAAPGRADA